MGGGCEPLSRDLEHVTRRGRPIAMGGDERSSGPATVAGHKQTTFDSCSEEDEDEQEEEEKSMLAQRR